MFENTMQFMQFAICYNGVDNTYTGGVWDWLLYFQQGAWWHGWSYCSPLCKTQRLL